MRRMTSTLWALALMLVAMATLGVASIAQDDDPIEQAGHPLVGAWIVDIDTAQPDNPPSKVVFGADGSYIQVDTDGSVAVGSWEPTGPQTAAVTVLFHGTDPGGAVQAVTVRASAEAAADGETLTASYTLEFGAPDGTSSGQLGPATATGTRIVVEPMGTPVGPLVPPSSPAASPGAEPEGDVVDVTLQEWAVLPAQDSATAGEVAFNVTNDGPKDQHEFVVIRTELAPDALPTTAEGGVDEEGAGIEIIGEIEEFAPGETTSASFDLAAGSYVFVCNLAEQEDGAIEAHYQMGMYAPFTVS